MVTVAALSIAPIGPAARASSASAPAGLPPGSRLMVLAPHEDDETLATGHLIAAARQQGLAVKVVFVTGGDGFSRAAKAESGGGRPTAADYLALAAERRKEAIAATTALGLSQADLVFLGYPDLGLKEMLLRHWTVDDPYRSDFTGSTRSPYPDSYRPQAPYAGQALLTDLEGLIAAFRPTVIAAPHPGDVHTDHWATAVFTQIAVMRLQAAGKLPAPGPLVLGYVVHAGPWPYPPWSAPDLPLPPPQSLAATSTRWVIRPGGPVERGRKALAIAGYRSQLRVAGDYLSSFARTNEFLGAGRTLTAARVDRPPATEADWRELPVAVANPWTGAALGHRPARPDWSQARLAWDGRRLHFRLQLTSRPRRPAEYRVYVYLPAVLEGEGGSPAAAGPATASRMEVRIRVGVGASSATLTDPDRGTVRPLPVGTGPDGRSVWSSLELTGQPFPFYIGFEGPEGTAEAGPATWSLVR